MTFLHLPIPSNISSILQSIPLSGKIVRPDPSDHATLFYFEQEIDLDYALKIIPIVQKVTTKVKPFIINFSKFSSFPSGKYGTPIICPIKSSELIKLRSEIKNAFEDNDIEFSNKFPQFKPHVTLGYYEEEHSGKFNEVAFPCNKIIFELNSDNKEKEILKVEFPFGNTVKYSEALLDHISGHFEKLANDKKIT